MTLPLMRWRHLPGCWSDRSTKSRSFERCLERLSFLRERNKKAVQFFNKGRKVSAVRKNWWARVEHCIFLASERKRERIRHFEERANALQLDICFIQTLSVMIQELDKTFKIT